MCPYVSHGIEEQNQIISEDAIRIDISNANNSAKKSYGILYFNDINHTISLYRRTELN